MTQVTIYMNDDSLAAAKEAATRAKLSLSKWFAQFADMAKTNHANDWQATWAEIDRLRAEESDDDWDFLLDPAKRAASLGTDSLRETLD